ncbi:hypothetical protein BaRGS_00040282, partial [Batillaria attramentaria]
GFISSFITWTRQYPKIYGCFMLGTPSLVVSDLDLVRDVLVKKFAFFPNRVTNPTIDKKPWSDSLLNLKDDHWKHVRSQLSPTFSSGKLKKMTQAIERVAKNLHIHVKSKAETGEEVELKKLCRSYAIDNIAGVAFGLQVDSLKDPNDPFIKHGTDLTTFNSAVLSIIVMFPFMTPVLRMFGITFPPQAANSFFMKVLDSALKERRFDSTVNLSQLKHTDFLQLLVEAEREGETQGPVDAEIDHGDQLTTSKEWTRKGNWQQEQNASPPCTLFEQLKQRTDEMYSNTFIFLFAGNETVSAAMSFTLFCLAANPDCLAKAQAEVDARLGKKSVTYETAMKLPYLDMCMNESLRMYPPGFILDREAHEDTEIGGYHVAKGTRVLVPVISIHRDPAIWPDPMTFDPERLAQLEIRMAIATILQHFTPVLCDKSVYPPRLQKFKFDSEDGLWVKFQARQACE